MPHLPQESIADRTLFTQISLSSLGTPQLARVFVVFSPLSLPLVGLNPTDTEHMVGVIREIRNPGVALVVIEHVMNVIVSLCSRLLVLHHGQKIADGPVHDVMRDRTVLGAYLGPTFTEEVLDRASPRVDGAS